MPIVAWGNGGRDWSVGLRLTNDGLKYILDGEMADFTLGFRVSKELLRDDAYRLPWGRQMAVVQGAFTKILAGIFPPTGNELVAMNRDRKWQLDKGLKLLLGYIAAGEVVHFTEENLRILTLAQIGWLDRSIHLLSTVIELEMRYDFEHKVLTVIPVGARSAPWFNPPLVRILNLTGWQPYA